MRSPLVKKDPTKYGSLYEVLQKLAHGIGLEATHVNNVMNMKGHYDGDNGMDAETLELCHQNQQYFELMHYTTEQLDLIQATQFPYCPVSIY